MRAFLILAQNPLAADMTPNDFIRNNLQNTGSWVAAKTFVSLLENHPQVIQFALESSDIANIQEIDDRWKNWNSLYSRNQIWTIEIQTDSNFEENGETGKEYTIYLSSDIYPILKSKLQNTILYEPTEHKFKAQTDQRYILIKWNLLKMKSEQLKTLYRHLIEEVRNV